MKRFRFRMDRVLAVRGVQERVARASWLAVERTAQEAEARVETLVRARADALAILRTKVGEGPLKADSLLVAHGLLARADVDLERERQRARTLRAQADAARAPWLEKKQDVEALARLKERAADEHRSERAKDDASTTDEVASTRHVRRTRGQNPT